MDFCIKYTVSGSSAFARCRWLRVGLDEDFVRTGWFATSMKFKALRKTQHVSQFWSRPLFPAGRISSSHTCRFIPIFTTISFVPIVAFKLLQMNSLNSLKYARSTSLFLVLLKFMYFQFLKDCILNLWVAGGIISSSPSWTLIYTVKNSIQGTPYEVR